MEKEIELLKQRIEIEVNVSEVLQTSVLEFLKDKLSAEDFSVVEFMFIEANFRG